MADSGGIMETCKIISYDLRKQGRNYEKLTNAIHNYLFVDKVCESTWIIKTNQSCSEILENLNSHIDQNDRLFVAEITNDTAGKNLLCQEQWLRSMISRV